MSARPANLDATTHTCASTSSISRSTEGQRTNAGLHHHGVRLLVLVLVMLMGSLAAAAPNITWPTSDDSISVLRGQLTLTLPLMTREPAGPWREVETFVLEDKKTAQLTLRIHET